MSARVLRIHWHDKKPVFSMDIDPNNGRRLVTAGGDNNIRIWNWPISATTAAPSSMNNGGTSPPLPPSLLPEYRATLAKHIRPVNCIRFSHSGDRIASVSDGGSIIIWKQTNDPIAHSKTIFGGADGSDGDGEGDEREFWSPLHTLRASDVEDIYDLAWSPDDRFIVFGLTDNCAQIWDLSIQKCVRILKDHQHFVQGVAWDPFGNYIVTASADRSVKIWQCSYKSNGSLVVYPANKLVKLVTGSANPKPGLASSQPITRDSDSAEYAATNTTVSFPMFHDETLVSFFRRPAFSPDGALLFLPAGLFSSETQSSDRIEEYCVYVSTYDSLINTPVMAIGGFEKPVLGIRSNPRLFRPNPNRPSLFGQDYLTVFAAFTMDALLVFDTSSPVPIYHVRDLHYGSLTDAVWSPSGMEVFISSTDGFCSVVTLNEHILGMSMDADEQKTTIDDLRVKLAPKVNSATKKPSVPKSTKVLNGIVNETPVSGPTITVQESAVDVVNLAEEAGDSIVVQVEPSSMLPSSDQQIDEVMDLAMEVDPPINPIMANTDSHRQQPSKQDPVAGASTSKRRIAPTFIGNIN